MASSSSPPSDLELYGPTPPGPEPLRIVKHRNTVSSSYPTGHFGISDSSGSMPGSDEFFGSSPDRPGMKLTINRTRAKAKKPTILSSHSSFGDDPFVDSGPPGRALGGMIDAAKTQGTETTPRRVKLKYTRRSSDTPLALPKARKNTIKLPDSLDPARSRYDSQRFVSDSNPFHRSVSLQLQEIGNPVPNVNGLQRKWSRSKKMLRKAFKPHTGNSPKPEPHLATESPKGFIARHVSRKRSRAASRSISSETFNSNPEKFDTSVNLREQLGEGSLSRSSSLQPAPVKRASYILGPKITVTPQISSVDARKGWSIWAAVEVTGVLQKLEGAHCDTEESGFDVTETLFGPEPGISRDTNNCGYLYGLSVTPSGGRGCLIDDWMAPANYSTLRLGQTHLFLVKVRLNQLSMLRSHFRGSSEDLMAELESQLGNMTTEFLHFKLSYKHSGFLHHKISDLPVGISFHCTSLTTEARALINRHDSSSQWSGNGANIGYRDDSYFEELIKAHYDPGKAQELINRFRHEPKSPRNDSYLKVSSGNKRHRVFSDKKQNKSSDTMVPAIRPHGTAVHPDDHPLATLSDSPLYHQPLRNNVNTGENTVPHHDDDEELDPAQKIWRHMFETLRSPKHSPVRHARDSSGSSLDLSKPAAKANLPLRQKENAEKEVISPRPKATPSYSFFPSPFTPKPVVFTGSGMAGSISNDPARAIWTQMRETSKGARDRPALHAASNVGLKIGSPDYEGGGYRSLSAAMHRQMAEREGEKIKTMEEIRQTALKNQRSVGADTLRSLAGQASLVGGQGGNGQTSQTARGGRTGFWGLGGGWW